MTTDPSQTPPLQAQPGSSNKKSDSPSWGRPGPACWRGAHGPRQGKKYVDVDFDVDFYVDVDDVGDVEDEDDEDEDDVGPDAGYRSDFEDQQNGGSFGRCGGTSIIIIHDKCIMNIL